MVSGIDTSVLLAYYQSRSGATLTGLGSGAGSTAKTVKTPTPPWSADSGVARASALVTGALAGKAFINEGAAQLDVAGSSPDYRKLFALYQGLNTLYGLAEQASKKGVSDTEVARLQTTFDKGLALTRTAALPTAPIDPSASTMWPEATQVQAPAPTPPTPENLSPDLRLVIEEDDATKTYVYKTVNRMTGEVIQQFPRDQVLKMKAESDYRPGKIIRAGA